MPRAMPDTTPTPAALMAAPSRRAVAKPSGVAWRLPTKATRGAFQAASDPAAYNIKGGSGLWSSA